MGNKSSANKTKPVETSLHVRVPLVPTFSDGVDCKLEESTVSLSLSLVNGAKVVTTPSQRVGTYKGNAVEATLSVWYNYDAANKKFIVCSNDYKGDKDEIPTVLTLSVDGSSSSVHTYGSTDVTGWLTNVAGLTDRLQQSLRSVYYVIHAAGFNAGVNAVVTRHPPVTLSNEDAEKFKVVVNPKGDVVRLHDPNKPIEAGNVIMSVVDSKASTEVWAQNQVFANVDGSTNDPKVGSASWISLYGQYATAGACASYQWTDQGDHEFKCTASGSVLGGHVIKGATSHASVSTGGDCYIIPICPAHNNTNYRNYMKVVSATGYTALHLTGFMK